MSAYLLLPLLVMLGWLALRALEVQKQHQRELGRFSATAPIEELTFEKKIDRWFATLGRRVANKRSVQAQAQLSDKEMGDQLKAAGLETVSDQGKFALVRIVCLLGWLAIVFTVWGHFSTYYATVYTIFVGAFAAIGPTLWLSRKKHARTEDIQRELPLIVDLTNLATSAGWDVGAALEKVIDALAQEFPRHPLLKEFSKARWLASTGYTWGEALDKVSRKLGDDTVTRVNAALVQAMDQGGDRSEQLAGIADDAQRTYYAALDKRLAAVPVKALIIMVLLFLTYFIMILAPAMVGVGSSF